MNYPETLYASDPDFLLLDLICFVQCSEAVAPIYSVRKVFLKILQNSQEIPAPGSPFFKKKRLSCNFIKKRLWHRYFPVDFTIFLKNTSDRCFLMFLLVSMLSLSTILYYIISHRLLQNYLKH